MVSIIIPCYHEEGHLETNVAEVDRIMGFTVWPYEIVFVEDGSRDRTPEIVRRLAEAADNRRAIFHDSNKGRGEAVMTGIRAAKGEILGFIDIDLEVHARYIPDAVSMILDRKLDMVVGRRDYRVHLNVPDLFRHVLSVCYRRLAHWFLPKLPVTDTEAGFKFFRASKALEMLDKLHDPGWFWDTEVAMVAQKEGLAIGEIDCLFVRRSDKKSTVRPFRDSWDFFVALRKYSARMESDKG